ncbi:MAG: hypothetical protein U9R25_05485 [Chloroflexota bacterium]|nr:hypothetical protein [Chloroflexota bacterium]
MSSIRASDAPCFYEIRVNGCLDPKWSDWFDGFIISSCSDGESLLVGPVPDQAALHGLLAKIRDVGLALLLVKRVESDDPSWTSHNFGEYR